MSTTIEAPNCTEADRFKVGESHTFLMLGKPYREGAILPGWFCNQHGSLKQLVAKGVLQPTLEPLNTTVSAPAPKTETDKAPIMANELNRLQQENDQIAAGNRDLLAQYNDLKSAHDGRIETLAKQSDEIVSWQNECKKLTARIAELEDAAKPKEPKQDEKRTVPTVTTTKR